MTSTSVIVDYCKKRGITETTLASLAQIVQFKSYTAHGKTHFECHIPGYTRYQRRVIAPDVDRTSFAWDGKGKGTEAELPILGLKEALASNEETLYIVNGPFGYLSFYQITGQLNCISLLGGEGNNHKQIIKSLVDANFHGTLLWLCDYDYKEKPNKKGEVEIRWASHTYAAKFRDALIDSGFVGNFFALDYPSPSCKSYDLNDALIANPNLTLGDIHSFPIVDLPEREKQPSQKTTQVRDISGSDTAAKIINGFPIQEYIERDTGQYAKNGGNIFCPFCEDSGTSKSPSFHIYPDTNSFHCFACLASGNVIGYVAKKDGISNKEAFERLAKELGVWVEREEYAKPKGRFVRPAPVPAPVQVEDCVGQPSSYVLIEHNEFIPKLDFVAIAKKEIALIPNANKGNQHTAHCPFCKHNNSLPLNITDNRAYCFSCQWKGDIVDFVMKKHDLSEADALEHCANRLGFTLLSSFGDCDDEQPEANYGEEPPDFFEAWEPEEPAPSEHEGEEWEYLGPSEEPGFSEENTLSAGEAAARVILADQTQGSISGHVLCKAQVTTQIRERFIHVTPYPLVTCAELPGVVLEEIKPGLWKNTKGDRELYTVYGGTKSLSLCEPILGYDKKGLEAAFLAVNPPTFDLKRFVPNNDALVSYFEQKHPEIEISRNKEKYLTAEALEDARRVVFVIGPTGWGKTTAFCQLAVKMALEMGTAIALLYIAHLRKLIQSFCETGAKHGLAIDNYEDLTNAKRLKSSSLALCINSLCSRVDKDETYEGDLIDVTKPNDLVLFDEIVSNLDVLVAGDTITPFDSARIKKAMKIITNNGKKVIFADATLGIQHINILIEQLGLHPSEITIIASYYIPSEKKDITFCEGGRIKLITDVIKDYKADPKGALVLCTSKNAAIELYELFKAEGLPCLPPVHSDSTETDIQAYIEKGLLAGHIMLGSPSTGTGIDLNVRGIKTYVLATLGVASPISKPMMPITAAQVQQMAGRNRQATEIRVYTENQAKPRFVKSTAEYEKEIMEGNFELMEARCLAADLESLPLSSMIQKILVPLNAINTRNNHWLLNNPLKHLAEHFKALGNYKVDYEIEEKTLETIAEAKELEAQVGVIKNYIKEEVYDATLLAADEPINDEEWKRLNQQNNITDAVRAGRRAYQECKAFGLERAADLSIDADGNPKVETIYLTRDLHDLYTKGMGKSIEMVGLVRRITRRTLATYVQKWGEGIEIDDEGNERKVFIKENTQCGIEDRAFVMADAGLPLLALIFGDKVLNLDGTLNWDMLPTFWLKSDLESKDKEVSEYLESKKGAVLRAKFGFQFKPRTGENTPRDLLRAAKGSPSRSSIFATLIRYDAFSGLSPLDKKDDLIARAQMVLEAHRKANPGKVKEIAGIAHRVAKALLTRLGLKIHALGAGAYELEYHTQLKKWSDHWATVDSTYDALSYLQSDLELAAEADAQA